MEQTSGRILSLKKGKFSKMTNTNIPENNEKSKGNRCIETLKSRADLPRYTAVEILLGSNDLASDILAVNGLASVDKEGFVEYDEISRFYGISVRYLDGIFQRNWISARSTPDYVRKDSEDGRLRISSSMVLALSAIMYQGRSIPEDSRVMTVYKSLTDTRYYKSAKEKIDALSAKNREQHKKRSSAIDIVENALNDITDTIEVMPNGKVLMSVSGLAKIVGLVIDRRGDTEVSKNKKNKGRNGRIQVIATKDGISQKFESMTECAKHIGSNPCSVSAVACVPNRKVKGYSISYA